MSTQVELNMLTTKAFFQGPGNHPTRRKPIYSLLYIALTLGWGIYWAEDGVGMVNVEGLSGLNIKREMI